MRGHRIVTGLVAEGEGRAGIQPPARAEAEFRFLAEFGPVSVPGSPSGPGWDPSGWDHGPRWVRGCKDSQENIFWCGAGWGLERSGMGKVIPVSLNGI